jgi:DNA-directed RNA polymerase specialized sigma24 family protein
VAERLRGSSAPARRPALADDLLQETFLRVIALARLVARALARFVVPAIARNVSSTTRGWAR